MLDPRRWFTCWHLWEIRISLPGGDARAQCRRCGQEREISLSEAEIGRLMRLLDADR